MENISSQETSLAVKQDPQVALPKKNTLTWDDWDKWAKETLIYNIIPVALILLQTLQAAYMAHGNLPNGTDFAIAFGASYGALLAAGINILGKYKQGV